MAGIAPSERFRRELDDVLAGVDGEADPVERIGRLGARLPGLGVTAFGTEGRLYRQGLEIGRTWRVTAYACTRGMPRSRSSPPRTWTATCARATWSATARYPTSASDGWSISPYAA